MNSFDQNYDDDALLTETERSQLQSLDARRDDKVGQLVSLIAKELGLSEEEAREEAWDAIDQWEEEPEPTTPMQGLLHELYEIDLEIMNIRDCAIEREIRTDPQGSEGARQGNEAERAP